MRRTIIPLALAAALAGCAANPVAGTDGGGEPASAAGSGGDSAFRSEHDRLLYQLLVGEFAGNRGAFDRAAEAYAEAAALSTDPTVAARAARVALYAERPELARRAARRWLELDPGAREASRLLALVALRSGDTRAAVEQFVQAMPPAGAGRDRAFGQIGATLAQEGDAETALAVAEALAGRFADDEAAQYALGQVALRTGYPEEALAAAEDALALRPGWRAAQLLAVEALNRSGDHERALERLRGLVEASPGDYDLRREYAGALAENGRAEQALAQFRRLLERQPDDERTLLAGALLAAQTAQPDQARQWLKRLLALGARTDAAHYYLGRLAAQQGEYASAVDHFSRAGGEYRTDAQLGIATAMAADGRLQDARQRLQTLRAENANAAVRAYATEAELLRRDGQLTESLAVLERALTEYPENTDLLYARAMARIAADSVDAAIADLRTIVEREPDNAAALNALGYTLADRSQELERAAELVRRAHRLQPNDPAVIDSMGWVAYRQGRLEEAAAYLERAYRLSPGAEIAAHFGEVLWQLGQRERARRIWQKARADNPGNAVLTDTMERLKR